MAESNRVTHLGVCMYPRVRVLNGALIYGSQISIQNIIRASCKKAVHVEIKLGMEKIIKESRQYICQLFCLLLCEIAFGVVELKVFNSLPIIFVIFSNFFLLL